MPYSIVEVPAEVESQAMFTESVLMAETVILLIGILPPGIGVGVGVGAGTGAKPEAVNTMEVVPDVRLELVAVIVAVVAKVGEVRVAVATPRTGILTERAIMPTVVANDIWLVAVVTVLLLVSWIAAVIKEVEVPSAGRLENSANKKIFVGTVGIGVGVGIGAEVGVGVDVGVGIDVGLGDGVGAGVGVGVGVGDIVGCSMVDSGVIV